MPARVRRPIDPVHRVLLWVAALGAGFGILMLGGSSAGGAVPLPPSGWDKLAHGLAFFLFGGLTALAFQGDGQDERLASVLGFMAAVSLGSFDEWRQAFTPGRVSSFADLLADVIGGACGAIAALLIGRRLWGARSSEDDVGREARKPGGKKEPE